jgi:hypothetical protein
VKIERGDRLDDRVLGGDGGDRWGLDSGGSLVTGDRWYPEPLCDRWGLGLGAIGYTVTMDSLK